MYAINKVKAREQCLQTIKQKIFMRRKLKMEVKRENITLKKLHWYLFDFLVTRHFQLCQKLLFSCLDFLSYFCYFETFYFQVLIP